MSISSTVNLVSDAMLGMAVFESFLATLAEIAVCIGKFKIEQDSLVEIGCYFYRAASVISQLAETSPESAIGILQSLSRSDDFAKDILGKLQQSGQSVLGAELKNGTKQLEGIINQTGQELSSIPISAFKDKKYVETAVRSLAEEMKRAQFQISPIPETRPSNQQIRESNPNKHSDREYSPTEIDIYSISTEVCTENSQISDIPQIVEALRSASQGNHRRPGNASIRSSGSASQGRHKHPGNASIRSSGSASQGSHWRFGNASIKSSGSASRAAQYVEPIYRSFICPLSNLIMDDPVTIQSGVTYERKAITEYFESFGSSEEIICPATRERLQNTYMSPNIALRSIIQEWKDRDETARLKVIREALSIGSSDGTVLEALKHLKSIWEKNPNKIIQVRNMGIMPLMVRLLELKDRNVRCAALETIRLLTSEEEEKISIGNTSGLASTVRMLSSSYQPIRHAACLLLIELSKSKSLSEKIGCITGGILILIRTKYNRSIDTFASEAADQVLKNMEQCPTNIKFMAENGYLVPFLNNLLEGDEERKLEMVTYLGEITLEDDSKINIAKRTSPVLAEMLRNGNPSTRKAVFKALTQLSSHPASGKILVKAGIIGSMVQEMFSKKLISEPMDSLQEALAILTNILDSGVEIENLMVNSQGDNKVSGYVVFNIIYLIENTTLEDFKIGLIRILYHMAKSSKSAASVLSAVKESELNVTLLELLNAPRDEIAVAAIKLLTLLIPQMGHSLIDRLCKTNCQPEGLVQSPSESSQFTERQALSAVFLAKLPHQNLTLNLSLVSKNTVPGILQSITQIQRSGARHERHASMYLEGLVGIVVRITATLYDPQMLLVAINYNFTAVLTELLSETSSNEVQRLAATGLEKLSAQSIHLSKLPQRKRKKFLNLFYLPKFLLFGSSRKTNAKLCIVHKGICFKQNSLCLIEAKAVERLLTLLEHQNAEVAEAALLALSTLMDDKVDLKQCVHMLSEMNFIQQVLIAIRHHKNESLWQKAFWMLERFLMIGGPGSVSLVSQNKLFYVTVVTAFHHGEAYTRQMAENILRHLNRMPSPSATFTM